MTRILPIVLMGVLFAAGCSTTPDTTQLTSEIPNRLAHQDPNRLDEETDRWWTVLGDSQLDRLAERAGNVADVTLSEARLDEARARLDRARSVLRPEITVHGAIERLEVDSFDQETSQARLSFDLNLDLNGAKRSRAQAEQFRMLGQAARVEAVRIRARSAAVQLYAAVYEAKARASAADQAVAVLEDTLEVSRARYRAGLTSGLDVASIQTALSAARIRPLVARQAGAEAQLGLEALLGLEPGRLAHLADHPGPIKVANPRLEGLSAPASVLARRPEMRAAELELWAAGADAQAARRDFWPTLSLAGALGAQDINPVMPFTASGFLTQAAVGLSAPVFSFGRLSSARDAADARRLQAQINYRQAAIDALVAVERAVVVLAAAEARAATLSQALDAAQEEIDLSSYRYRAGLSSIDPVLEAQAKASDAEDALAMARREVLVSFARFNAEAGLGGFQLHRDASSDVNISAR